MSNRFTPEQLKAVADAAKKQKASQKQKTEGTRLSQQTRERLEQDVLDGFKKKIRADTLASDEKKLSETLSSLDQRQKSNAYVDPKEWEDAMSAAADISNRYRYYERYLDRYGDENGSKTAVQNALSQYSDMSRNLGSMRDFYGQFDDAEAFQTYTDKKKREDYLTNEYDLAKGKAALDEAKNVKNVVSGILSGDAIAYKKRYDEMAEDYRRAKNLQRIASYDKMQRNPDFATKSVAGDDVLSRFLNMSDEGKKTTDMLSKASDFLVSFAPGGNGIRQGMAIASQFMPDINDVTDKYHALTDEQKKVYNYINNTKGTAAALEYLYDIGDELSRQAAIQQKKEIDTILPDNWLGDRIGDSLSLDNALHSGMEGAISSLGEGIYQTFAQNDRVLNTSVSANRFGLDREEAGKVQKVLLDLAQTTGNMIPSIVVSTATGVPILGAGMMGIQAKGAAYNQAIKEGYSPAQAQTYSTMVGALEGGLSYALTGIGKGATKMFPALGKAIDGISNGFLRGLASWGVEAAGEGLEEGLTEFFDPFLRYFVTGKYEGVNWQDVGYSAFLGALSGGFLEGTPAAMKAVSLPDATAEAFKTKYDTGNGYEGFSSRLFQDDTLLSAKVIELVKADDANGAIAALNKGLHNYRFAKEYAKQHYGVTAASDIDKRIQTIETLKASIKAGKFNAQSAETALRKTSDIWQIAAENNDAVVDALTSGNLSNSKIEQKVLKDRGTINAFKRKTGVDLDGLSTISQKRQAVREASAGYQAFVRTDAYRTMQELTKANETEKDASKVVANKRSIIDGMLALHNQAMAEADTARRNGNNELADQKKMVARLADAALNSTRNDKASYFASNRSSAVDYDELSALGDQYLPSLSAEGRSTLTGVRSVADLKRAEVAVKEKLNKQRDEVVSKKAKRAVERQLQAVDAYFVSAMTSLQNVNDAALAEARTIVDERIKAMNKNLRRYGVTVEGFANGVRYFDTDGKEISYDEVLEKQRRGEAVRMNVVRGMNSERTLAIARDIASGVVPVMNPLSGQIVQMKVGRGEGMVSPERAVDIILAHEAVHYAEKYGQSGLVDSIIHKIAGTRLDTQYELANRMKNRPVSEAAAKNWDKLKNTYADVIAKERKISREEALSKVDDAYLYEEIAADYMGTLMANNSFAEALAAQDGNLFKRIVRAIRDLLEGLRNGGMVNHERAAKDLATRLEAIAKKTYGRMEKKVDASTSEKAAESPVGNVFAEEGTNEGDAANANDAQEKASEDAETVMENADGEIEKRYSVGESSNFDSVYDEYLQARDSFREAKRLYDELTETEEHKAAIEKLHSAKGLDELEKAVSVYQEYEESSGLADAFRKMKALEQQTNELSKRSEELRKQEAAKKEADAIKKSGLEPSEYRRKEAVKEFGYTPYFYDAGYLLPNGKLLNFSGEKGKHFGSRGQDHRAIGVIYENVESGSSAMLAFMGDGNIRVMAETPGIDIAYGVEPSKEQYEVISRFVQSAKKNGFFSIDITDEKGNTVANLTYEDSFSPVRIVNDIKHYFETGEVREQSTISQFRYSVSEEMDLDYLSAVERQDMEKAQSLVDEAAARSGYSRRMYHGSKNGGGFTVFRDWGYFTENRDYAQRYAQRENEKSLYEVYVKMDQPFDTRDPDTKEIFEENIRPEYGTSEIQDSGLPDWTDGYDIADYIDENDLDYDSIVLDEGGDMVNGKPVSRGLSYVVKHSAQVKSADPVTYDDNGNVVPLSERFNDKESDIRYSISETLEADIDSILDGTFDASRNELYLGETSNFLTDVIGADSLSLFMPASKAYSSLVTKEEYEKKPYYSEQDNYHGIGKKDFIEILEKSEHPIAAFASLSDEKGNKRQNRIVLVTDKIVRDVETGKDGYAVVIEEVDAHGLSDGKRIKANKAITIYPRTKMGSDLSLALSDGRLLAITQKGEHLFAGVRGSNPQAAIRKDVLANNIAHFWENVKWLDEKNKISSSEGKATPTAMQEALQKAGYAKQYMQNGENDTSRHSVSEEVAMDDGAVGYEELKRQVAEQKEQIHRLTEEMVLSHGTHLDVKETGRFLKELLDRYGATLTVKDIEADVNDITEYLYRKYDVTRDEQGRFVSKEKVKEIDAAKLNDRIQRLATRIMESAVDVDSRFEEYTSFLKTLHNTPIGITKEIKQAYGDGWGAFRQRNFGRLNLRNAETSDLSAFYQEMADNYPEILDSSISDPVEQLKQLADAAKTIRETGLEPKNIYGLDGESVVADIAYDFSSGIASIDPAMNFADKAQQKVKDARLGEMIHYGKKIAAIRERYEARLDEMAERFATKVKDRSEAQQARYQKKMVEKRSKDLAKRLAKPTKAKHIPEEMVADVYDLLKNITWPSKTKVDRDVDEQVASFLQTVEKRYGEDHLKPVDGVGFPEALKNDIKAFNFKALDSQNAQQLHNLNELLRRAVFAISNYDKVFHSGERASVESMKAFDHFRVVRKEMGETKWWNKVGDYILNYAEDPEAFFTILNVPELTEAYHRIGEGQDKLAKNVKKLTADLADVVGEKGVPKEWREQVSAYTVSTGTTLRMTPAQLMSLYLYSKQADSRKCLLHDKGGIAVAATEHKMLLTDKNGHVIETNELGKLKSLKDVRHIETASRKIGGMTQLDEDMLDELLGHLTKEQREMADRISVHLNTTVADMANETSLETEGYRKFINENYFPMLVFDRSKSMDEVIRDMHGQIMTEGFTKERTGLAGKKLIVDDIFSVVNRHDVSVAQYNAYKKALLDYKKLLTIRPEGDSSLESQIQNYFGVNLKNRVSAFLNDFLLDVQGVQMATGEETLLSEKFLRNYKAAQVAANLSVVAKQPTSILRAMPEFTQKGIAAMKPVGAKQLKADIAEMQEHSGLAFFKANGYSEYANARSFEELYNRNALSLRDHFDNAMSKGAEQMDLMTWAALWRAAKAETNSIEEATAKFNEVIRKTQVVDTALTSSRITKQNGLMKMAFAFRNEPLKSFNYIRATFHDYAIGKEGSGKKLAMVLASSGANALLNAAITAAVSMLRDDEEGTAKDFFDKTNENFWSNILGDTLIFAGDFYDAVTAAFDGRTVERMDLAAITDTVEALISVYKFIVTPESERRDTLIKLWHNVTKAISNLTGIPISNFSRFQHTLGSLIGSVFNDPWLDYLLASRYYNADGFDNTQVKKKFRSILTDALNDGDYEGYARVKNELLSKGFSTSEIEKAIANSDVFYEAFNKGPEAFRAEVNAAQKYDPSISSTSVMSAIKSRKTGLVSDLYDAAKVGDKKAMQAVRDELLQLRDVDTKRLLTDKDIDRLLQEKYEKQLKSDVKERLVDLYGTEVYETIKRVILSEYRKFGVTSEEIDRIARSLR